MKKKVLILVLFVLMLFGCKKEENVIEIIKELDIVFTNDVHCAIEQNLGYAKVKAYVDDLKISNKNVCLVDCGDFIQGDTVGSVTKGETIINIMNEVGYEYVTLGNHEFDYGMDRLYQLMEISNFKYLNCNITYTGSKETSIVDKLVNYEIKDYDGMKIGFIGVTTPESVSSSTPIFFKENNEYVYSFGAFGDSYSYIDKVQEVLDTLNPLTDYIVCLSHLGYDDASNDNFISSNYLVNHTSGIDVVLDGHSHEKYEDRLCSDKTGKNVIMCETGTKLEGIGHVVIKSNGTITTDVISELDHISETITKKINVEKSSYDELLQTKIFTNETELSITDSDGVRMVRSRETGIGNLISDAYRIMLNADIGIINGGGVRANLKAGDVTYNDIISINPYGNTLCVVEVTGQEVCDILECCYYKVLKDYKNEKGAIGEDGSFACISGLKCEIDTNSESSAVFDEKDNLISVGNNRRVKNVKILENGEYVDIDLNKTYRLASHTYMIKNGGMGMG